VGVHRLPNTQEGNPVKRFKIYAFFVLLLAAVVFGGFASCDCGDDDDDDDDDSFDEDDILSDDGELKNDGVSDPPPMFVDPERPLSGSTVGVTVEVDDATSITLTVEGAGCGLVAGSSGGSPLVVSGAAAASGSCHLVATATMSDGATEVLEGFFEVQASDPFIPPVTVTGGVYTFENLPATDPTAPAPAIAGVDGPATFINGGTSSYEITFASDEDVTHVLVGVAGYQGYYMLPVTSYGSTVSFEVSFDSDIFLQPKAKASAVDIFVVLLDAVGAVSDLYNLLLDGVEVAEGEVKVSLSWDTPTDVDLHVMEPSGEEIFYGHKVSATGGQLDLDSNPGCSIDGINNENVFWPEGLSPSGEFIISAEMYSDCEIGGASGTVTITYCGDDSPLVEPFALGPTGDADYWMIESYCGNSVAGTMKYEDFEVKLTGLSSTGSMVPVRFARVQVVREDDDEVLAESHTNSEGEYELTFINDGEPGYFVRLIAEADKNGLKQVVKNLEGKLYTWKTDTIDERDDPFKTDLDLEVERAKEAGALNIFEIGVRGWQLAWSASGRKIPKVEFFWTRGAKPQGQDYSFATSDGKVYILGMEADTDEYDDVVIGHEYGHVVHSAISKSDSPGGSHSSNDRIVPALAFSEGWATYFGCMANKVTAYMDTKKNGMRTYYSIETPPAGKKKGNKGNKLDGNLSEAIVAAVLMDLDDSTNETKDTISKRTNVWNIMTNYLQSGNTKFKDRGKAGRDLVDFLDGWFCLGYGDRGDDTKGVQGNVKGMQNLSYDFAAVSSCK
jgi:hypothetical protein